MEKLKEFFKNKRNLYIVGAVVGVITLAIILIFVFKNNSENKDSSKDLLAQFETVGLDFYENFYYPQTGTTADEIGEFLAKYSSIGIKVSLNNLASIKYKEDQYGEILNALVEKCDKANTKVIVYPEAPYGAKSYRSEIVTDCQFEQ